MFVVVLTHVVRQSGHSAPPSSVGTLACDPVSRPSRSQQPTEAAPTVASTAYCKRGHSQCTDSIPNRPNFLDPHFETKFPRRNRSRERQLPLIARVVRDESLDWPFCVGARYIVPSDD